MSRRRFENLDAERQQRLFESAAEEFGDHGYEGASLNRIIARSGMSKSSLYYYFDDKADLFSTLIDRSIAFVFREVGGFDPTRLTAETYWQALEDIYQRGIGVVNRHGWLLRFGAIFYRLRGDPARKAITSDSFEATGRWVTALLARGQDLGVIRRDLPDSLLLESTMALLEVMDRWVVLHWNDLDEAGRLAMCRTQIDMLRRLLAPER